MSRGDRLLTRRLLRSPVARFLAIGILTIIALVLGTNQLAGQAASREALAEARSINEVLARSVVNPSIPPGLASGLVEQRQGALDRFG